MINKTIKTLSLSLCLVASSSQATILDFYDTIFNGQNQFTTAVTSAGSSVSSVTLNGLSGGNSWDLGDFTISTTDGFNESIYGASYDNSTGEMIGIDPRDNNDNGAGSGLTFTFDSAVNALGFEVGDWATCCFTSELFISFDGGAAIKVASATNANDNPATAAGGNAGDAFFVGAIDDSSQFTTVTFFGNGFGEFLTAGGTIMYSALDVGSVTVPEPSTIAILGLAMMGLSFSRRKA
ncbi:PEP-CTERM sorting domain-containing protein [Thalassotalea sp. 1_MG-2023]|uniref:PEP-CTERM sorting domain-containing protein n=1 Tax=Thalassotalea sp. 1_MG-2023 TaxID=3062680 RepID=UPI0026E3CCCB|nr:PEP-CTERM sorting domain-containing protein [Thalassotalea sp. 1_MG-2023]MDO6428126.1 PEP-CTERM sorting domain-containing protein [Thalassotalea sp. 1_MG-2023]